MCSILLAFEFLVEGLNAMERFAPFLELRRQFLVLLLKGFLVGM